MTATPATTPAVGLTLATWLKIDKAMQALKAALAEADFQARMALRQDGPDGAPAPVTGPDEQFLKELLKDLDDAETAVLSYDTKVQSEWAGGPSTGPEALPTKLRAPRHKFRDDRRHITQAEIDQAVAQGLLPARGYAGEK